MAVTPKLGLVLSGGGARGAYEAGVLHYIRTALAEPWRSAPFQIISGTSVGAINAAFAASTAHDPITQGRLVRTLWENVDQDRIFRRDWGAVGGFLGRTAFGMARNFLFRDPGKPHHLEGEKRHFVSLFDTRPLPAYLDSLIDFDQIALNCKAGVFDALVLAATSLTTNEAELLVQKGAGIAYQGGYVVHKVRVRAPHVMASGAIPFAFPPVKLGRAYYCDGGVRMNTPISPAIQLGANRVLVIGMHAAEHAKLGRTPFNTPPRAGRLLNAMNAALFQDRVRYDLEQLGRINRIVEWGEAAYGSGFLERMNEVPQEKGQTGDIASRGLKKIEALAIFPSRDLSTVFTEQMGKNPYLDPSFMPFERFSMRLLDVDPRDGSEVLSFLAFSPPYLRALLDLGYHDAQKRHTELEAFFSGAPLPDVFSQIQ